MTIQLMQGDYSPADTLDLITQMIHVKIKYHEKKMMQQNNEKNIKMQETIIRQLQKDLFEARKKMEKESSNIIIESQINFISY
jgi:hypothetical protein